MNRLKIFLLQGSLLFLVGCNSWRSSEPLSPPFIALETATSEARQDPLFENGSLPNDWWRLFNDEQLNVFIEMAFVRNPTLKSAYDKVLMAAANADRVRATLFPSLNWGGDVSHQKLSETGVIPFGNVSVPLPPGGIGIPVYFSLYETQLTLNYQFDLWGKNRNTIRAALGEVQAQIADLAFARLQLGTALATVYFQLQIDYEREKIAQALVENRMKTVTITEKRLQANVENALSVNSVESDLASARQALLQIQGDIAVKEIALKTYLAGDFEEAICDIEIAKKLLPRVPLSCDLPLHLIANRPDIAAQLSVIESAGRQIDVAKAGFYPDVNLFALFGFQTIHFRELFKWPSTYFNVDPAFTLPLFDGGRLLANLHGSEVNYDLAIDHYNELILNAAKEVLQGIAVLRNAKSQLEEFDKQWSFQQKNYELTQLRSKFSLNSNVDILTREALVLTAQEQDIQALGVTLEAIVFLIKALGGGYAGCLVQQ